MGRKKRGYPTRRLRLTIGQRLAPVIGVVAGMLTVQLCAWYSTGAFPVWRTVDIAGWCAFYCVVVELGTLRFDVTLTPWTAELRRPRRVIWWRDVRTIRVEKRWLSRRVVIYELDGRRTRLNAPITGFLVWDKHFEDKYHAIGTWYLEHRMIESGETGPVDARPDAFPVNDAVPDV